MNSLMIHAWSVSRVGEKHYLPYTHWIYLKEIQQYFDKIYLLSPTRILANHGDQAEQGCINTFPNVSVIELPDSKGYIGAVKYFVHYVRAYRRFRWVETFYSRYPIPFGWLQKVYGSKARRIIHFVGDPVDATLANPLLSKMKKRFLISAFTLEHKMYLWACKGAKVYTNGFIIANKLKFSKINAKPLISSTLEKGEFFINENKKISPTKPRLIYLGYLRKAKGVETVIEAYRLLLLRYPGARLTLVGSGEFELNLKKLVEKYQLQGVSFIGHVDNRAQINTLLRNHDIFCFASLSEGSPRVILEAMANGINVISTPVGSLPKTFQNNEDIIYAAFNDPEKFCKGLVEVISNRKLANKLRHNAYKKVKDMTLHNFIKEIFK